MQTDLKPVPNGSILKLVAFPGGLFGLIGSAIALGVQAEWVLCITTILSTNILLYAVRK